MQGSSSDALQRSPLFGGVITGRDVLLVYVVVVLHLTSCLFGQVAASIDRHQAARVSVRPGSELQDILVPLVGA